MSDFVTCLRLAQEVFEQYKTDHPKWWKRMDGTPILNDVAVLMAQKFVIETERLEKMYVEMFGFREEEQIKNYELKALISELCDALECHNSDHLQDDLLQRAREATR